MQKERELKRKQVQVKKEAEAQARLVVLKVIFFHKLFRLFDMQFRKNAIVLPKLNKKKN